jgi:hypothetical protein
VIILFRGDANTTAWGAGRCAWTAEFWADEPSVQQRLLVSYLRRCLFRCCPGSHERAIISGADAEAPDEGAPERIRAGEPTHSSDPL